MSDDTKSTTPAGGLGGRRSRAERMARSLGLDAALRDQQDINLHACKGEQKMTELYVPREFLDRGVAAAMADCVRDGSAPASPASPVYQTLLALTRHVTCCLVCQVTRSACETCAPLWQAYSNAYRDWQRRRARRGRGRGGRR
jgi:hypothetical protein